MNLNENERIDDLELNNLKIIQNTKWFCFGIDSVLLSDFCKDIHKGSNILDLGAGNGILELLLSAKIENSKITAIEVQKEVYELAKRNIVFNHLENRVIIQNKNIKDIDCKVKYDAVVTNPPYKEKGTGLVNEEDSKVIARHEVLASLDDFIRIGSRCLKDKGNMYIVNRAERLADVLEYLRKYRLEPKELKMVYSKIDSAPVLILVKATKNANRYLRITKPLYIYNNDGTYTKEICEIYNKEIGC